MRLGDLQYVFAKALKKHVRDLACVVLHSPSRSAVGACECPACSRARGSSFYEGWCQAQVVAAAESMAEIEDGDDYSLASARLAVLRSAVRDLQEARKP